MPTPPYDLEQRTRAYAIAIVRFCCSARLATVLDPLLRQLIRCGTSIGANYRGARRGRSSREFVSKLSVALEEADETEYWLDVLIAADQAPPPVQEALRELLAEARELRAILAASRATAIRRRTLTSISAVCLILAAFYYLSA